jgi:hypothetical protein
MAVPVGARRRQCLHRAMSSASGSASVTEVAASNLARYTSYLLLSRGPGETSNVM